MKDIQILEFDDVVQPSDWCRPLTLVSMSGGMSDDYSFKSCYTGAPENNAKWTRVARIFGAHLFGKPANLFQKFTPYEFVRGQIPKDHIHPDGEAHSIAFTSLKDALEWFERDGFKISRRNDSQGAAHLESKDRREIVRVAQSGSREFWSVRTKRNPSDF